jgi:hypothetical protein
MSKPDMNNCTAREWEAWFWETENKICISCTNSCKQSDKVVVECDKFKKIT